MPRLGGRLQGFHLLAHDSFPPEAIRLLRMKLPYCSPESSQHAKVRVLLDPETFASCADSDVADALLTRGPAIQPSVGWMPTRHARVRTPLQNLSGKEGTLTEHGL